MECELVAKEGSLSLHQWAMEVLELVRTCLQTLGWYMRLNWLVFADCFAPLLSFHMFFLPQS
ncbi:hypothetical protein NMG60_11023009 [Bertholletia excelsa]